MPALHRMPVTYLVVTIGLTAWVLTSRVDRTSPSPIDAAKLAPPLNEPPPADPPDPFLRTPEGLRRKALIRSLGVVAKDSPEAAPSAGDPALDYYAIVLLAEERDGWLRVGRADGRLIGWVPADDALEWDTRLMARPVDAPGQPPLRLFRERECLLDRLAGRRCPDHADNCPIEGELDLSRRADPEPPLGLPILRSEEIPQPDGTFRTIMEVASLVEDRAPAPLPPARPPDALARLVRRLDVAFVVDTTASMQSSIDACKRLADDLARASDSADVTLRLALVEYRDESPAFGFPARIAADFRGSAAFRASLNQVKAADRGDGTVDEAVLAGVRLALPHDGPGPRLSWRSGREGELATKLLILIGDAPDHAATLDGARELASRARGSGITIASVSIDRPGVLSRDEARRYRDQWTTLATESDRPLDPSSGFAAPIEPVVTNLSGADRLRETLDSIIADRTEAARKLAALIAAEAEGRLQDYLTAEGLTLDRIAPVLVDVHRGEPEPTSRPDPRLLGMKAPSVRRGWIAATDGAAANVRPEMLMSRGEVDLLIDELTKLQQALHAGATDLSDLIRIGNAAASGETSFLAADRGRLTFAEHLARRRGLPPLASDQLWAQTQGDLLRADDPTRAALARRLASGIIRLIARRNESDWEDPSRTVDGLAGVPYDLLAPPDENASPARPSR